MSVTLDPQEAAKQAVLQDRKTVEAYGRLLVECDLFNVPTPVLVGALLEASKALHDLDREKREVWRQAGETFLGGLRQRAAERVRRRSRPAAEEDSPREAANAS